jgi:hypothetical protein
LLNAGLNQAALNPYELFRDAVQAASWRLDARQSTELAIRLAVTHLRIGKQQNCLEGHNPDSCLFPIRDGGIHRRTRGVLDALRALEPALGSSARGSQGGVVDEPRSRGVGLLSRGCAFGVVAENFDNDVAVPDGDRVGPGESAGG